MYVYEILKYNQDGRRFGLILSCIKNFSTFDRSFVKQLRDFIKQVENILPAIHKSILINYLKGKVVGKFKETLHRQRDPNIWILMKQILKDNFGKKKKK